MISFVTPTYNRAKFITQTLDSIFILLDAHNDFEVIVVDDASKDDTLSVIHNKYKHEIKSGVLKIITLDRNQGVTAAKNYGVKHSNGEWIVFLDSDDLLVPENYEHMVSYLKTEIKADVVFFSCIDFKENRIGEVFDNSKLTLETYLEKGTFGEKLPVIRRDTALNFPYDPSLRGFEGIAYLEMLINHKALYLNNLVCRKYRMDNNDRLSSLNSRFKRSGTLSRGFYKKAILLYTNGIKVPKDVLIKIPLYAFLSLISKIKR